MIAAYRISYLKTALPAAIAGVGVLSVAIVVAPAYGVWRGVAIALGALAALPLVLIATSGFVVLLRDVAVARGRRDPFLSLNDSRSEAAIGTGKRDIGLHVRRFVRTLFGLRALVVGDEVETLELQQIRDTLDETGCLEGLPFMPEMIDMCGRRARVFRRVDKVYDYGGKKVLRRLEGTVLLCLLRCDGSGHGGCQAGCYAMWKEAWLKRTSSLAPRVPVRRAEALASASASASASDAAAATGPEGPALRTKAMLALDDVVTYRCQFTQLVSASAPIHHWDPRLDLRPLIAGNITLLAFAVALLTRLFNYVQVRRGGNTFPSMLGPVTSSPVPTRSLMPGESVLVQSAANIAQTLDKGSKNRGLWFDRDMVKHCGRPYVVLKRVERIIDDATGRMRTMKTPCIVLRDVTYSGEYLRFLAQEEHLYWREAWLQAMDPVEATFHRRVASGH